MILKWLVAFFQKSEKIFFIIKDLIAKVSDKRTSLTARVYHPDGLVCFMGLSKFVDYPWRRNDFREESDDFFALFYEPVKIAVDHLSVKYVILRRFLAEFNYGRL